MTENFENHEDACLGPYSLFCTLNYAFLADHTRSTAGCVISLQPYCPESNQGWRTLGTSRTGPTPLACPRPWLSRSVNLFLGQYYPWFGENGPRY